MVKIKFRIRRLLQFISQIPRLWKWYKKVVKGGCGIIVSREVNKIDEVKQTLYTVRYFVNDDCDIKTEQFISELNTGYDEQRAVDTAFNIINSKKE